MKKLWPSVACSAVLLSGCMYGSATAPITALNPNSNQYQQGYQSQPNRAPVGQIHVAQGQAVALTPTRIAPARTAVAVPQPQPQPNRVSPAQQQQGIEVQAQSPYSQPVAAQPTRPQSNDDGWSVAPQTTPTDSRTQQAANNDQNQQQNNNQAEPLRPTQPQQTNTTTNTTSNTTAGATVNTDNAANTNQVNNNQDQQVASATPPQQPSAPAKEETAVSALLKKASASLGKGDLDGAAAYLENAQRIEPQNAKILYDIANIRYHQGRYKDAETFAGRAVQVGGGNGMMKKSWALVANARKSLGDNQGAIAAAEKAASFGN